MQPHGNSTCPSTLFNTSTLCLSCRITIIKYSEPLHSSRLGKKILQAVFILLHNSSSLTSQSTSPPSTSSSFSYCSSTSSTTNTTSSPPPTPTPLPLPPLCVSPSVLYLSSYLLPPPPHPLILLLPHLLSPHLHLPPCSLGPRQLSYGDKLNCVVTNPRGGSIGGQSLLAAAWAWLGGSRPNPRFLPPAHAHGGSEWSL